MAGNEKIEHRDLPAPKPRTATPESRRRHGWDVIHAFLTLVLLYVLVHKALIPLVLKLSSLKQSPYAKMDLWLLHPLALWFALRHRTGLDGISSFLTGGGIAYAALEVIAVAYGHYPGWLAVSHILTSVPVGLVCIALVTRKDSNVHIKSAWSGVLVAIVFIGISNVVRWP